jgi:hypothetical protein
MGYEWDDIHEIYPPVSSNVAMETPLQVELLMGKSATTWVLCIATFEDPGG